MSDTITARERLVDVISFTECCNYGTTPDALLDAFRDQVLTEAADYLERIADLTEAQVADHYGPASGIGPGSADMVRLAAGSVRSLAARTTTAQEG